MTQSKLARPTKWLLLLSALAMSSGCCRAPIVQPCTETRPKPTPLPEAISQTTQPDSTELLKRAEDWSESSRQLLDSVTPN